MGSIPVAGAKHAFQRAFSLLSAKLGISSRTIAKIGKGEKLANHVRNSLERLTTPE